MISPPAFYLPLYCYDLINRHQCNAETAILIAGVHAAVIAIGASVIRGTVVPTATAQHIIGGFLVVERVVPILIL